jgi:hypothetical protein
MKRFKNILMDSGYRVDEIECDDIKDIENRMKILKKVKFK